MLLNGFEMANFIKSNHTEKRFFKMIWSATYIGDYILTTVYLFFIQRAQSKTTIGKLAVAFLAYFRAEGLFLVSAYPEPFRGLIYSLWPSTA